jgi:GNAT superfamily N-acetyltransferase
MLPSLELDEGPRKKPRVLVLEVRDRDEPAGEVIAQLLVERQEEYEHDSDGSIWKARIELAYRLIGAAVYPANGQGEFRGSYSATDNRVCLTMHGVWGHGFVTLDLPGLEGQRIGSYLMNEIVCWVLQWPHADVNNIELLAGQAHGKNADRRNRFYERFGFVFDYGDPRHRAGMSRSMKVRDLKPVGSWKENIIEHRMFDFLADLIHSERDARAESKMLSRSVQELCADQRRAEAHPIWWAAKEVYYQHANWVIAGVLLASGAVFVHPKNGSYPVAICRKEGRGRTI